MFGRLFYCTFVQIRKSLGVIQGPSQAEKNCKYSHD